MQQCHSSRAVCPVMLPIPAVLSQNVTNKSCLVCTESEKYAFLVNLRPLLGSMRRGQAELCSLRYWPWWSWTTYIKTHFNVSSKILWITRSPPQCIIWNWSFRLMPKAILGGGFVEFKLRFRKIVLMQVFISKTTKPPPKISLGTSLNRNRISIIEERT